MRKIRQGLRIFFNRFTLTSDDGLSTKTRHEMAERYRQTAGKPPTPEEMARIKALIDSRRQKR